MKRPRLSTKVERLMNILECLMMSLMVWSATVVLKV